MPKRVLPAGPVEDWPNHEREAWIESLPKRVRAYIEHLQDEIVSLEDGLEEAEGAVAFDELLAQAWDTVACLRVVARDEPGAWRAWRAAKIARIT